MNPQTISPKKLPSLSTLLYSGHGVKKCDVTLLHPPPKGRVKISWRKSNFIITGATEMMVCPSHTVPKPVVIVIKIHRIHYYVLVKSFIL